MPKHQHSPKPRLPANATGLLSGNGAWWKCNNKENTCALYKFQGIRATSFTFYKTQFDLLTQIRII